MHRERAVVDVRGSLSHLTQLRHFAGVAGRRRGDGCRLLVPNVGQGGQTIGKVRQTVVLAAVLRDDVYESWRTQAHEVIGWQVRELTNGVLRFHISELPMSLIWTGTCPGVLDDTRTKRKRWVGMPMRAWCRLKCAAHGGTDGGALPAIIG